MFGELDMKSNISIFSGYNCIITVHTTRDTYTTRNIDLCVIHNHRSVDQEYAFNLLNISHFVLSTDFTYDSTFCLSFQRASIMFVIIMCMSNTITVVLELLTFYLCSGKDVLYIDINV
jgi:hypothetical protein